ncbi:hypothetical protein BC629DRAFT_1441099 [Irpex lacteus]|nr:hypothetical protein BC629DRAFT_1441099 [Irpex lacteus]
MPVFVWWKYVRRVQSVDEWEVNTYAYRIPSERIKGKHSYVTPPEDLVRGPRELSNRCLKASPAPAQSVDSDGSLSWFRSRAFNRYTLHTTDSSGYGPACARENSTQCFIIAGPTTKAKCVYKVLDDFARQLSLMYTTNTPFTSDRKTRDVARLPAGAAKRVRPFDAVTRCSPSNSGPRSPFSATTDAPPRFWGPAELGVPRGARDYPRERIKGERAKHRTGRGGAGRRRNRGYNDIT